MEQAYRKGNMAGQKTIGIPVKLLHESEGHTVTVRGLFPLFVPLFVRACVRACVCMCACAREGERKCVIVPRAAEGWPWPRNMSGGACLHDFHPATSGHHDLASDAVQTPSYLLNRHLTNAQIELKTGEQYRGVLKNTQDNWNCQLEDVTYTARVRNIYISRALTTHGWCQLATPVSVEPSARCHGPF